MAAIVCARPAVAEFIVHAKSIVTSDNFFDGSSLKDTDSADFPGLTDASTVATLSVPAAPVDSARHVSGSKFSGTAAASAKPGILRASLVLDAAGGGGNDSFTNFSVAIKGTGEASAGWSDTVVLHSAAVPFGTPIEVRAPMIITGLLIPASTTSPPDPHRTLDLGSSGVVVGKIELDDLSTDLGGLPQAFQSVDIGTVHLDARDGFNDFQFTGSRTELSVPFLIRNGQPYRIAFDVFIQGSVVAERDNKALFDAEFQHTVSWGGIQSVQDAATGTPINDWTITSDSGFDYSQPAVPEPTSLTLFVCAGGLSVAFLWRTAVWRQ